ncbi:hypothetical protein [Hyphomonas sp.]|uniref:hypothetical protein n=1 Tax=Hyphomonas sp. TaxID=87 RepID=UPI00391C2972
MAQDRKKAGYGEDDMSRFAGWDALADDVFGLNVRGFRTMWAAVFNPARVFEAARDPDWLGRYTPAIRLVFVIMALTMTLQFLWAYEGSSLWNSVQEAIASFEAELDGRDPGSVTREIILAFAVLYPVAYFTLHIPASLLIGFWGKGVTLPVRSRLYFSTIVPAGLVSLAVVIVQHALEPEPSQASSIAALAILILAYSVTIFRGLAPAMPAGGRLWRAGLMTLVMVILSGIAEFIALLAACIYVLGTPSIG